MYRKSVCGCNEISRFTRNDICSRFIFDWHKVKEKEYLQNCSVVVIDKTDCGIGRSNKKGDSFEPPLLRIMCFWISA